MTEREPVEANEAWLAKMRAEQALWARRAARRRKVAMWFLIPYVACPISFGWAAGRVLEHGMRLTFVALLAGYLGLMASQWIQPELLRRGDAKDGP